jgi:hypothetical protein
MEAANLAEAIRELNLLTTRAADVKVVPLDVEDQGQKITVPVAMTPAHGGIEAKSLLEMVRHGAAYAKELRLQRAAGPDRREGTAAHQSLESFIQHANRFKAPHSAVWANPSRRTLTSVLDYHPEGWDKPARWGKHRGTYLCPLSEAWQAWGGGTALKLEQQAFAELLDSRDRELASGALPNGKPAPDPAALITLASNLEVYSTATAKRERDPNTGRLKLSYTEDKGVSGTVVPPPSFLIFIPVFQDNESETLEVRLRVEVEDGQATFLAQIHAAGDVLRRAFTEVCDRVGQSTELPVFHGEPE